MFIDRTLIAVILFWIGCGLLVSVPMLRRDWRERGEITLEDGWIALLLTVLGLMSLLILTVSKFAEWWPKAKDRPLIKRSEPKQIKAEAKTEEYQAYGWK